MEVAGIGIGLASSLMRSGYGMASLPPVNRRQMLPILLARGAANGLPRVITMRTAAGICRAASRPMMPPRLQPTRLTGRSVAAPRRAICARIAGISASDGRTLRPGSSRGHHSRARTGSRGWQPSNGHRLQAPGGRSRHDGSLGVPASETAPPLPGMQCRTNRAPPV